MCARAAAECVQHFRRGRPSAAREQYKGRWFDLQPKVIVWVNHCGWIMGEIRTDGAVTGLRFTKARAGAKPYDESTLEEVLRYVEGTGCHYDLERDYFGEAKA